MCHRTLVSLSRLHNLLKPFNLRSAFVTSAKMSSLHVKNIEGDERLQIYLDLNVGDTVNSFSLDRLKQEELRLALERLRTNIEKKIKKKAKKKKRDATAEGQGAQPKDSPVIVLDILHNGQPVPQTVPNEQAWISGAVLRIGEEDVSVVVNAPSVKIQMCPLIMVGYPMFAFVEYEFCTFDSCEFHWKTIEKRLLDGTKAEISRGVFDFSDTSVGFSYTPTAEDLDKHVLLLCKTKTDAKIGKTETVLSSSVVTHGPGTCLFKKRHSFTKEMSKFGEFRVISYNILAEIYTATDFAKTELFVHCPDEAMEMNYRKQLLLKEIAGYQADLICLQEVDMPVFKKFLKPGFNLQGFEGFFRPKRGGVAEGCATFVRKDKFRVIDELDIILSHYLAADESCQDMWDKICQIPALKEKLEQRSSILQVTVVESVEKPGQFVCLANTHLYFHPNACNIRLIHSATALRYLQTISVAYAQEGKKLGIVFCGDFNSSPDVGVYQLMTSQFIQKDHADWLSAGEREALTDVELSHTMNIVSACGTPEFTHFGAPIQCTLDYIYVETSCLDVVSSVPLLDREEVSTHTYLPNPSIPSDHLALVSDIKIK